MAITPTQRLWRGRIEAVLGVVAPALDLLLAAGDRISRTVERDEVSGPPPRRAVDQGRGRRTSLAGAGERDGTSD